MPFSRYDNSLLRSFCSIWFGIIVSKSHIYRLSGLELHWGRFEKSHNISAPVFCFAVSSLVRLSASARDGVSPVAILCIRFMKSFGFFESAAIEVKWQSIMNANMSILRILCFIPIERLDYSLFMFYFHNRILF